MAPVTNRDRAPAPIDPPSLDALQQTINRTNETLGALLSEMQQANATVASLRSRTLFDFSTGRKTDQDHATGALYKVLREEKYIRENFSSDVGIQRAAIAAVDAHEVSRLDLSKKGLKCIPREITRFTAITRLFLDGNQLCDLPANLFDCFPDLRMLNLSNNQLRALPPGIFDGLSELMELQLRNNLFYYFPDDLFQRLSPPLDIYFYGNPLKSLPLLPRDVIGHFTTHPETTL